MQIKIPVFFWYVVAACLLAWSTVLLFMMVRSQDVTIAFNDVKLTLAHTAVDLETANKALQLRNADLEQQYKAAQLQLQELTANINDQTGLRIPTPSIEPLKLNDELQNRVNESLQSVKQQLQKKD